MTQQVATVSQTNMFGILDADINRVFKTTEIKDKTGAIVGASMVWKGRKEIGEALALTGKANKDALDLAALKESDAAFVRVKQHMSGLNGDTTLKKFSVRTLASGVEQTTIITQKISRSQRMSDEKLANGMFPVEIYPAMTLEDKLAAVVAMRASQEAHLAKNLIEG